MKNLQHVLPLFFLALLMNSFSGNAQEFGNMRLALEAGYGYRTAETSSQVPREQKEIVDRLRGGFLLNGKFQYFFQNNLGVGLLVENYKASETVRFTLDGQITPDIDISENFIFIAPEISTRYITNNGLNSFIFGFATGYVGYIGKTSVVGFESDPEASSKTNESTIGFSGSISYDFLLSDSIAIGATFNYLAANFRIDTPDGNDVDSQSRVGIKAGIRFYF